nr:bifunctional phosphopantothenoylcysteine decarboxylase/phosphopantothenate--cysteine ligase CoaBC [candidate division Zixibacteria bacterium]
MPLKDKKILVGLTGGIAAYKTPILIRLLKKAGAEVRVVMTEASTRFITELTVETVSQNPVAIKMFPENRYVGPHHIDMAAWPDLFVIAPATANFIGKAASGICDDLLTTVVCATKTPIMIAPSMNSNMYLNPITQNNIEYLKSLGYIMIDPNTGEMACETYGPGRMAEPEEIYQFILQYFSKKKVLEEKTVVVTAGPCREAIDPVRFISNRSSGKMGYALARAAYDAGAKVVLISGPTNLKVDSGIKLIRVESTGEMYRAVKKEFARCDYLIMAAAPADFTVAHIEKKKIKKEYGNRSIDLIPAIDILKSLKPDKKRQKVIGFALETDHGIENARAKLKNKSLDLIVLNEVGETTPFDNDSNQVTVITKRGKPERLAPMPKMELAVRLIEYISRIK